MIEALLAGRGFEFAVERAVFTAVLHRLVVSGSDRACETWMADYAIPGIEGLQLHHFYRAMAWLGEETGPAVDGALAPRCIKDVIEEQLLTLRVPCGHVLRTNARITPLQAVPRYRDLLQVEDLFRQAKAALRTRPICHSSDAAIRGLVFCSFLALVLRKELQDRCRVAGSRPEWGDGLRDLDRLQDVAIDQGGKHLTLRTPATGVAGRLFQAARVALRRTSATTPPPPDHPSRPTPRLAVGLTTDASAISY